MASGGAGEPGSWNRYAYVEGDPVNFNNLEGLAKGSVDCGTPCIVRATPMDMDIPAEVAAAVAQRGERESRLAGFEITSQVQIWEYQLDEAIDLIRPVGSLRPEQMSTRTAPSRGMGESGNRSLYRGNSGGRTSVSCSGGCAESDGLCQCNRGRYSASR